MSLLGSPATLPQVITAIGGLGTAAFGLVDATKLFWGGVNHIGFNEIRAKVALILPAAPGTATSYGKDKRPSRRRCHTPRSTRVRRAYG